MNLIGLNTTYDKNPCIYSANKVVVENGATRCQYLKDGHLMQFTGLRDNKRTDEYPEGQEVYEGDVVNIRTKSYYFPKYVIGFNTKYTRYVAETKCNDAPNGLIEIPVDRDWKIEVIGNVFENPELLGGKI